MQRFSGFNAAYDQYRPAAPEGIIEMICQTIGKAKPQCVVDLGCGTGNSTKVWQSVANQVIGIDVNPSMLHYAQTHYQNDTVKFQLGYGNATGLPDHCADIITCSSSIHWMEPESTLAEMMRILKPHGVLAAYGPQIPYFIPSAWHLKEAFTAFWKVVKTAEKQYPDLSKDQVWKWGEISQYISQGKFFRHFEELTFHTNLLWTAHDYRQWLITLSPLNTLIEKGNEEVINAYQNMQSIVSSSLPEDETVQVHVSYRLLLGVR